MPPSLLAGIDLQSMLTHDRLVAAAKVLVLLLAASVASALARRIVSKVMQSQLLPQHAMLMRRVVTYIIWVLTALLSLQAMNIDLSLLFGAVGIIGGAAVLASQRGLSQAFSGLILVAERPFNVGDTVTLGGVTGEVLSVDLLSTKLRTPDNLFVRVPNETTLNSLITTVSHFPIRRLDIQVGVGYGSDIDQVSRTLFEVAQKNPVCLEDPKPIFMFLSLGDSALELQFCVWGRRERFLDLKNSMHQGIVSAFAKAGIDIPYPHRTVVGGTSPKAWPIEAKLTSTKEASAPPAPTSPSV